MVKIIDMRTRLPVLIFTLFFVSTGYSQSLQEGIKLYHYERYTSAEQLLQQSVKSNPNDINGWYWLARACQANNEPAKALVVFSEIPIAIQAEPLFKVIKGRIDLQKGDTVLAIADFNDALGTTRKKDPAIRLAIAEANIDLDKGNLHYALNILDEAAKRDGKNAEIYMAKGDAFRKLYNGSESFRNYQQASEINKPDPVIYYKIGKIYQTQNNPDIFTEYYTKAINADPEFGQVYYQLYYYYYFKDVNKAFDNLQKFISHSDADPRNTYLLADMYYISKKYNESIAEAQKILAKESGKSTTRLYKLLAYNYDALNNSQAAEQNLKKFFEIASDTTYAPEDFELMAKLAEQNKQNDEAAVWYEKAFTIQKDTAKKAANVRKLIAYHKSLKQYQKQGYWFEQLSSLKVPMNNVDIFGWGVADYNAKNYLKADSIFGIYETKHPDQTFGYYWRARSNAAIDTAMETGIAIPHYEALIKVAEKDTLNANNRKWLIQAYGYIAAFKVNKEKMYTDALTYYDKILQLDPANSDAEKYKGILEKMIGAKTDDKADPKSADKSSSNN